MPGVTPIKGSVPWQPTGFTLCFQGEAAMKKKICYTPIGVICSQFRGAHGAPIQAAGAMDIEGRVEVFPACAGGLKDLEGFSDLILLYHFHLAGRARLHVKPFLDDAERGVFATRAPSRPNSIGLSVVRLVSRDGNILIVRGMDMLDGTPLLDIKPYVPGFDARPGERIGWLAGRLEGLDGARADGRFT
jgi:tRNA-Thr(GGU) m(6)t(6)A37 methyltransferase TsaA